MDQSKYSLWSRPYQQESIQSNSPCSKYRSPLLNTEAEKSENTKHAENFDILIDGRETVVYRETLSRVRFIFFANRVIQLRTETFNGESFQRIFFNINKVYDMAN